ncbi:MAG: VanW family protein [Patescibacteria group bacterium]|jgi:vancomycin resistance protein YoaR
MKKGIIPKVLPKPEIHISTRTKIAIGCFLAVVILIIGGGFAYSQVYAEKFYPGVVLAGVDVGGQTYDEAKSVFESKVDGINISGFNFISGERKVNILPRVVSSSDLDISYDLVSFDIEKSLDNAWEIGRHGGFIYSWRQRLGVLLGGEKLNFQYKIKEGNLVEALKQNFYDLEKPGQNARLILTKGDNGYDATVEQEKPGMSFDYQQVLAKLDNNLKNLDTSDISFGLGEDVPEILSFQVKDLADVAVSVLDKAPLTLKFEKDHWDINKEAVAGLLDFVVLDGQPALGFGQELFVQYLNQKIGPNINQEVQNAKFKITDGRVAEFVGGQQGRAIDVDMLLAEINTKFVNGETKGLEVPVKTVEPDVATADVNDLGIKEIIGVGKSDFSGSPSNRRHNIATGSSALNGVLIKPGENFSLITALGPVEKETGYLPELVIKGNKTVPEYGGGLCQIGTTVFRAALDSGLPILERAAHSYRVSYYEPAGMDATIYIPHPDVVFTNDTGNHILIQAKVIGNNLRFEFWGTKDGRKTHFIGQQESDYLYDVTPKIWGFVRPAATKLIESVDIAVGTKKCTEKAHVGATAEFTYQVTYSSGEKKEKVFNSVYRPWQEVCLVGVEKLTEPEVPAEGAPAADGTTEVNTVDNNTTSS